MVKYILCLSILLYDAVRADNECNEGWSFISGKCLQVACNSDIDWNSASGNCQLLQSQGSLARVNDEETNTWIAAQSTKPIYIDGTHNGNAWVDSTGNPLSYFNWFTDQPDDESHNCVRLNSQGLWDDVMCDGTDDTCYACEYAPTPTRCEGNDTYNEDLSDNGFLARLGQGLYIVKVMKGRGYEGKPPNKPAVGYYDEPYGNDTFHLVEDTIRLGCKLGYTNGVGKPYSGSSCQCADGVCGFNLVNPDFICISEEEQAMPVWTGGVFNFVKAVYSKYIVLKARVANLLSIESWEFDNVDPAAHPEYLEESFWKAANFTLFVFCPFDVTLGGVANGTGLMTFPDFYPGEHSADGMLWSFMSREGTKLWKPRKCEEDPETNEIKCVWRSSYYKGFVDRSTNPSEQGPIEYNTNFQTQEDYSCETGILAGHHPHALFNLEYYFPIFQNGTFVNMVSYLRNAPFEVEDL